MKGGRGKEGAGGNRRAGGGERPLKRNIGVNAVRVDLLLRSLLRGQIQSRLLSL